MAFDTPMDVAWRAYRNILKQEGLTGEEMSIAQQSYKDGWHECELEMSAKANAKLAVDTGLIDPSKALDQN